MTSRSRVIGTLAFSFFSFSFFPPSLLLLFFPPRSPLSRCFACIGSADMWRGEEINGQCWVR